MGSDSHGNDLGRIKNARTKEQIAHMRDTIGQGKCPFCDPDPVKNVIIWKDGKYWQAWYNPFPYANHKAHIVVAAIKHWTDISEIPPEAWSEWGLVNRILIKKFHLRGGGLVMRFGEIELSAATLTHIHSHIQVPDMTGMAIAVFFKDWLLILFLKLAALKYRIQTFFSKILGR